jgi:alpha-glucosidase
VTDKVNRDNRPFILTRSTFPGSGRYSSHWLGDNWRNWTYMNYSIAGMMNMGMFGIPHVGADVCGFFGKGLED